MNDIAKTRNKLKQIEEGHLGQMADRVELDHEVQMARADLYKIAKYSIKLHEMLKGVSEIQGIEGWQQAKITKAADYLSSVYHNMDYEMSPMNPENVEAGQMDDMAFDLASESKETVKESRMGYSDADKLGSAAASKIDNVLRRKIYDMGKDIRDIEPGTLDRMRYQVAKELGLVESIEIDEEEAGYTDAQRKAMDDLVNSLGALGGHRDMKKPRYDPDMVKRPGYDPDIIVQQPRYDPDMVKRPGYDPRVYDPDMERDRTTGNPADGIGAAAAKANANAAKNAAATAKKAVGANPNESVEPKSKFSDWSKK